jgi:preprotein translocase subunit SecG
MKRKSIFTLGVLFFCGSITLSAQQSQTEPEKNNNNKPQPALFSVNIQAKDAKKEQPKAELKMFSVVEENSNNAEPKGKVAEPKLAPYSIETNPK